MPETIDKETDARIWNAVARLEALVERQDAINERLMRVVDTLLQVQQRERLDRKRADR